MTLMKEKLTEALEKKKVQKADEGKKYEYSYVQPLFLRNLFKELHSYEDAGRLIGVTGTTVSKAIRSGKVNQPLELAAQFIYEKDFVKKSTFDKKVTAIISGETAHLKTIQDLITSLGGKFQFIGDF